MEAELKKTLLRDLRNAILQKNNGTKVSVVKQNGRVTITTLVGKGKPSVIRFNTIKEAMQNTMVDLQK